MTDDARLLDETVEHLLRSSALWEAPSSAVGARIEEAVTGPVSVVATPKRAWLLSGIAAALVVVALLANVADAPDWRLDVVAADGATASGEIIGFNEPTGTRIVLEIHDLPPAEPGTFYEVWWVNDGGETVSSGSFLRSDTFKLWMGVRRADFPTMLITIEPADGDPTPSGEIVARAG